VGFRPIVKLLVLGVSESIGTALSSILLHSWHFLLTCAIPIDHNVQ
jgi:hypothetical protein